MTKNKTSNKTYFHETWLSDSKFMEWIVRFKKKKKKKNPRGKFCKCNIY